MKNLWYRIIIFLILKIYFRKIVLRGNKNILTANPVLYLALHKNGAVDGWVYLSVLPPTEVLIAKQLTKNPFLRMFFQGIEIVRDNDNDNKNINLAGLSKCVKVLQNGQNLLIFPEGTSTLGPKHLEFKKGAAIVIKKYLTKINKTLKVIPLGIYYDDPTCMGGKVEVVIGNEIDISSNDTDVIHQNIILALENVGVDTENEDKLNSMQQFATIASLYNDTKYYEAIKKAQNNFEITKSIRDYLNNAKAIKLLKYKNIYPLPQNVLKSLWTFFITMPLVLCAIVFNIIPLSIGYFCGKKFPDDKNVISLWRILSGSVVFMVWIPVLLICGKLYGLLILIISLFGFTLYGACKKHFIALINYFKAPLKLKDQFYKVREYAIKEILK